MAAVERSGGPRIEIGEMDVTPSTGRIEVIDGGMFSGKSKELIRRISVLRHGIEARIASGLEEPNICFKDLVAVFKPALDNRRGESTVNSKDGDEVPAVSINNIYEIISYLEEHPKTKVIAIDEAQFFDKYGLINVAKNLADQCNIRVIVAGLTKDFAGRDWGGVAELGSIANEHLHLMGACAICGGEATMTQRLKLDKDNNTWIPANINDEVEMVGEEQYQLRCRKHHQVLK